MGPGPPREPLLLIEEPAHEEEHSNPHRLRLEPNGQPDSGVHEAFARPASSAEFVYPPGLLLFESRRSYRSSWGAFVRTDSISSSAPLLALYRSLSQVAHVAERAERARHGLLAAMVLMGFKSIVVAGGGMTLPIAACWFNQAGSGGHDCPPDDRRCGLDPLGSTDCARVPV